MRFQYIEQTQYNVAAQITVMNLIDTIQAQQGNDDEQQKQGTRIQTRGST